MNTPIRLVGAAVAAIAATACAAVNARGAFELVAVAFALAIVVLAIRENTPLWRGGRPDGAPSPPASALARTTRLTALTYAWCGLTLLAVYLGTRVHWQHGWQYGSVLALIGAGNWIYVSLLEADANGKGLAAMQQVNAAVALAALQGIAVSGAMIWLISSGKLDTKKGDWAANMIFLAGGLALIVISAVIVKTHLTLTASRDRVEVES